MVGRHLCAALLDLMKASLDAGRLDLAEQAKQNARHGFGCPMERFDSVSRESFPGRESPVAGRTDNIWN